MGEVLIPYPVSDKRLERWLADAEGAGQLDVGVTVGEPKLKLTPRGVGKVVLFLLIAYSIVSALIFLTLTAIERAAG